MFMHLFHFKRKFGISEFRALMIEKSIVSTPTPKASPPNPLSCREGERVLRRCAGIRFHP